MSVSERGRSALAELMEVKTMCRLPEETAMVPPGTCESAGTNYGRLIVCCLICSRIASIWPHTNTDSTPRLLSPYDSADHNTRCLQLTGIVHASTRHATATPQPNLAEMTMARTVCAVALMSIGLR